MVNELGPLWQKFLHLSENIAQGVRLSLAGYRPHDKEPSERLRTLRLALKLGTFLDIARQPQSQKVLVVEGRPENQLLLRFLTKARFNHGVLIAHSCREAVSILETFPGQISAIVTDSLLDYDGFSLPHSLRLRPHLNLKVLYYSDESPTIDSNDHVTLISQNDIAPLIVELGLLAR